MNRSTMLYLVETDNTVTSTPSRQNIFKTVTPLSKALALMLFIALPFFGFYLGWSLKNNLSIIYNQCISNYSIIEPSKTFFNNYETNTSDLATNSSQSANQEGSQEYEEIPKITMKSLDGSLTAEIFFPKNPREFQIECLLIIKDSEGSTINYASTLLPKGNLIRCYEGPGAVGSDVQGWVDGNKLVIFTNQRSINILEPLANEVSYYDYDDKILEFVMVNRNLNRWLFRSLDAVNKVAFQIYDLDHNLIKDDITFPEQTDGYSTEYYDDLNDVFLFVTEQEDVVTTAKALQTGENVGNGYFLTRFVVLNLNDLSMYNVLTTDSAILWGKGCIREELTSKQKTLIIKSTEGEGCILIDDKYLNSNRELILNLR